MRVTACQCGACFHAREDCCRECQCCGAEFCLSCDFFENHVCFPPNTPAPQLAEESDDTVDTDRDSDGDVAALTVAGTEEVLAEESAETRFLQKGFARGDEAALTAGGIYFNRITGTAHMPHAEADGKSACGLTMSPLCYEHSTDECALIGCTLCWRSGCANWEAARDPTEPGDAADLEEIVRFAEDSEFASPMLAPVDLGDLVFPDL